MLFLIGTLCEEKHMAQYIYKMLLIPPQLQRFVTSISVLKALRSPVGEESA